MNYNIYLYSQRTVLCCTEFKNLDTLTIKRFLIHLLLMALLIILIFGGVLLWLKFYTNHGQEKELKNYVGTHIDKATKHAKKHSFQMIVKDSVHKVDQPGGLIIAQNPISGSKVKENRKIYVDITKYKADEIKLSEIAALYGEEYSRKKTDLSYLDIDCVITGYRHDPGKPDHILEVRYKGRLIEGESGRNSNVKIERGGTLEFVLSEIGGGEIEIPDLICRPYSQLGFLLRQYKLKLGFAKPEGAITDLSTCTIIAQDPEPLEGATMEKGGEIKVIYQQDKQISCQ